MKFKVFVMAPLVLALMANVASAQSVSGLSVKTRRPSSSSDLIDVMQSVESARSAEPIGLAISLLEELQIAVTPETMGRALAVVDMIQRRVDSAQVSAALLTLRPQTDKSIDNVLNLAVPAGATAGIGSDEGASAGPVLGFQAWKLDRFFTGAFFTLGQPQTVNGSSRAFGQFVRNPPAEGTSFTATGSYAFFRPSLSASKSKPTLLIGLAARFGVTTASFERMVDGEPVSKEAFVLHVTPSLQILSRTFKQDGTDDEYQFGLEVGPTWRRIGGDAAQGSEFLSEPDVLDSGERNWRGWESTLFVRLNAFQPFVRVTHFDKRNGKHVPGLTGWQAFFGANVAASLFQTTRERQ